MGKHVLIKSDPNDITKRKCQICGKEQILDLTAPQDEIDKIRFQTCEDNYWRPMVAVK